MDVTIRIAGEAGQGVQTTGNLLVGAFANAGLHVFSTQSYMSRIRGGLNWFDIRIGDERLFSGRERSDVLVALSSDALDVLRSEVTQKGVVISDGDGHEGVTSLGFTEAAKELTGSPRMANTVSAGAIFALLGYDVAKLCDFLAVQFKKKGEEVVKDNIACAQRGADLAATMDKIEAAPNPGGSSVDVFSGSEAVGLAAATAGVKLVSSYPMTPSTGVLTVLAGVADAYGIVVEQAEDEIAAINMVCGATYAGVPAMTTTSGGGFALMCEGLSLAGMMELPAFILLSQRPGPATGLPTRTGQEDLRFVLHTGHGEFHRAVFAPGTPRRAYELTRRALQTAHEFQTPVILMIDQFLADVQTDAEAMDTSLQPIDRHILSDPPEDYVRYKVTPNGMSARAVPGDGPSVICDSDEHTEDGHLTEDLSARVLQQDKRLAKAKGMVADFLPPERYGSGDPDILLIAWGSTYGPCREAVDMMNTDGQPAAMLHFEQLWPLDVEAIRPLVSDESIDRVVVVEGNSTGQFASVLKEAGLLDDCDTMLRYDGMPFTGEEIATRIMQ